MDRTALNIISLLLGGAGLFMVLTKFNVPELNMGFWGENPYAIKRDTIDNVMTWIFTSMALVGLIIQIIAEIAGDRIPAHHNSLRFNITLTTIAIISVGILASVLTAIGFRVARRSWLPQIIVSQREVYRTAKLTVEHDGHWQDPQGIQALARDPEAIRKTKLEHAQASITQIERLLDLTTNESSLKMRIDRLSRYFGQ